MTTLVCAIIVAVNTTVAVALLAVQDLLMRRAERTHKRLIHDLDTHLKQSVEAEWALHRKIGSLEVEINELQAKLIDRQRVIDEYRTVIEKELRANVARFKDDVTNLDDEGCRAMNIINERIFAPTLATPPDVINHVRAMLDKCTTEGSDA